MSVKCIARERIREAADATAKIDKDLWRAIERLQDAGRGSNGAGIYPDVLRFKGALREAAAAIKHAQEIVDATKWPSDHDYDIAS